MTPIRNVEIHMTLKGSIWLKDIKTQTFVEVNPREVEEALLRILAETKRRQDEYYYKPIGRPKDVF